MPNFAHLENAPHTPHHLKGGNARRFIDEEKAAGCIHDLKT
jgi:hypothetical protein